MVTFCSDKFSLSLSQVNDMKRSHVERDLTFAGFLVIICPLKDDSKQNIRCLHDSSHHVCPHVDYIIITSLTIKNIILCRLLC